MLKQTAKDLSLYLLKYIKFNPVLHKICKSGITFISAANIRKFFLQNHIHLDFKFNMNFIINSNSFPFPSENSFIFIQLLLVFTSTPFHSTHSIPHVFQWRWIWILILYIKSLLTVRFFTVIICLREYFLY
jgi:hypothetical protein